MRMAMGSGDSAWAPRGHPAGVSDKQLHVYKPWRGCWLVSNPSVFHFTFGLHRKRTSEPFSCRAPDSSAATTPQPAPNSEPRPPRSIQETLAPRRLSSSTCAFLHHNFKPKSWRPSNDFCHGIQTTILGSHRMYPKKPDSSTPLLRH